MRHSPLTRADFSEVHLLVGFEGGAVYAAEHRGKFYLIQDESTLADLLSEEHLQDLAESSVKVLEFDTAAEREAYVRDRGWTARAERQGRSRDL